MPINFETNGYLSRNGVFMRSEFISAVTASGSEADIHLLQILNKCQDLSLGSEEIQNYIHDRATQFHLSGKRADVLRPFAHDFKSKKILEIGCGCGVVTRFLGESLGDVVSLEENSVKASIAAARCQGLNNVQIVNDTFHGFKCEDQFDFVVFVDSFDNTSTADYQNKNQHVHLLANFKKYLLPDGKLLFATTNKLGLRYWTSNLPDLKKDDHPERSASLRFGTSSFLGYEQLNNTLQEAGFGTWEFLYPFPNHSFSDVIITQKGWQTKHFNVLDLLVEKFEYFEDTSYNSYSNATLAAKTLLSNNLLKDFSNSFLIIACAAPNLSSLVSEGQLAFVYSTSRKKPYCKETVFTENENTEAISVNRRLLYEQQPFGNVEIKQDVHSENYIGGELLFDGLLPIVSTDGWSTEDLLPWTRMYYEILSGYAVKEEDQQILEGKYVDLTPFNIILSGSKASLFDLEWIAPAAIPAYYVFFRGVAHSLGRLFSVNKPAEGTATNILELTILLTKFFFSFGEFELADCKAREIRYFSSVALNDIEEPFPIISLNIRITDPFAIVLSNEKLSQTTATLTQQNNKLLHDLTLKEKELLTEQLAHNELRKVQKEMGDQIIALSNDIQWYDNTYVRRNIPGTILQKLKDLSSHQKRKRGHYQLNPGNDIVFDEQQSSFHITGDDPYFNIDLGGDVLLKGWYWLDVTISVVEGKLTSPKLYFDDGDSFNETDIHFLPPPMNGHIKALINFDKETQQLRFDPSMLSCTFTIGSFLLKKISKRSALLKSLQLYKGASPGNTNWSALQALFARYKAQQNTGVREELRKWSQINVTNKVTPFMQWCSQYDTLTAKDFELIRHRCTGLLWKPKFSVVMPVFNPPIGLLRKAIESVLQQAYDNWEFCIADDCSSDPQVKVVLTEYQQREPRIKLHFREANGHISEASNTAIALATGHFIVLLDQDDQLALQALYIVAETLNDHPDAALLYSDEDKIDEEENRFDPYFKTDWNPDLFLSQNMISHLGAYKASIMKEMGGFRKGFEGSQDYDLALRFIERISASQIIHIPHILYHWRAIAGSTAVNTNNKGYAYTAGLHALEEHLAVCEYNAKVIPNDNFSYRVQWDLKRKPFVSIIIPSRDQAQVLSNCLESILRKTSYNAFEIIVIDNKSAEPATFNLYKDLQARDSRVKILAYNKPFNFSGIVNFGVSQSTGEVLVILNNDTEVVNSDWLGELTSHAMRDKVGAVGAKLLYPNDTIQHAGVFLYAQHPGIHIYQGKHRDDAGYFNKLKLVQNYSAVTAACLAIRKQVFEMAGGLDEVNLPVAYNDVDLCLKLQALGYYNVWTPFSILYHHESLSRGNDFDEKNIERFRKEHTYMLRKWQDVVRHDPFFNPNLAPETRTTGYAYPPKITYSWQQADILVDTHNLSYQSITDPSDVKTDI